MIEGLVEKFSLNSRRYIGGIMGFAFGYVFITQGLIAVLVVMLTTFLGSILGDKENVKRLKKILVNRLREE